MQRALSTSEPPGAPVKTSPAANQVSPPTVPPQKTPGQAENQKKELLKSGTKNVESPVVDSDKTKGDSSHGSPQKAKSAVVTQANKAIEEKELSPAPGSQTPRVPAAQSQPKPKEPDSSIGVSSPKTRTDPAKTTESVTGKMFGFGSSIFSSASTLISSAVQEDSRTTPPGSRKMSAPAQVSSKLSAMPQVSPKTTPPVSPKMSPAKEAKPQKPEQGKERDELQRTKPENVTQKPSGPAKPPGKAGETCCPLCKAELNIGSKDPPNHNTCTECKTVVCKQCGFNPMPMGEVSMSILYQCSFDVYLVKYTYWYISHLQECHVMLLWRTYFSVTQILTIYLLHFRPKSGCASTVR